MLDWRIRTIGDLIEDHSILIHKDGNHGANYPRTEDFGDEGFPFLTAKSLADGTIDFQNAPRLSAEKAKTLKFGFVQSRDVLLSHNATVGRVCMIPSGSEVCVIGTSLTQFRVNEEKLDPRFLALYFSSGDFQNQLSFVMSQTTRNQVPITEQRRLPISVPPLSVQLGIADMAFGLIDKIGQNRRTNETLEAIAQAIFRDWFVDFGPVRRKLAGETDPVAIMGGLTLDPDRATELAALFPAEFNESDLPQGWIERPLDQIAEFLNGLALQKFPAVEGEPSLPVIKIAELRNGLTEKSNRASPQLPDKYIVRDGDYLFSWSGSLMAKVWTEGDGALNQHLFKVSSTSYPQWFFAAWVEHHLPEFQLIAASKATTMGHIQRGHLTSAMTVCPPRPTLQVMATVLAPLWERRIHNDLENRTLAETRDYLLPRLMSGEVRVGGAETEEAAA